MKTPETEAMENMLDKELAKFKSTMNKITYKITVGEVGNEQGHTIISRHVSDDAAIAKARKEVAPYLGDGWYIVADDRDNTVARGGRFHY